MQKTLVLYRNDHHNQEMLLFALHFITTISNIFCRFAASSAISIGHLHSIQYPYHKGDNKITFLLEAPVLQALNSILESSTNVNDMNLFSKVGILQNVQGIETNFIAATLESKGRFSLSDGMSNNLPTIPRFILIIIHEIYLGCGKRKCQKVCKRLIENAF